MTTPVSNTMTKEAWTIGSKEMIRDGSRATADFEDMCGQELNNQLKQLEEAGRKVDAFLCI